LKRCNGNAAFASKIIAKYRTCASSDVREMERAFHEGDGQLLTSLAHRMKGASLTVSAVTLAKAAAEIEAAAQSGNMAEADVWLKKLPEEIERFEQTTARLVPDAPAQISHRVQSN
jgi:HPt (histidine-containing phosphotransfer) domain-containing protein